MPPFARLAAIRAAVVTPDERGSNSAHAEAMHTRVVAEFAARRYEVEHVELFTDLSGRARCGTGHGATVARDITPMGVMS